MERFVLNQTLRYDGYILVKYPLIEWHTWQVRKVIKAIGMYGGNDKAVLANSLKYSTTHFNDASTPANIRSDLDKM